MVDYDIFKRTVDRAWRTVAQEVVAPTLTARAVELVCMRTVDMLKSTGCLGLPELLAILANLGEVVDQSAGLAAIDQIESLEHRHLSETTLVACRVARRQVAQLMTEDWVPDAYEQRRFVIEILAELGVHKAMPGPLIFKLQRYRGWTAADVNGRRDILRQELQQSPQIAVVANQLCQDPSAGKVVRPRLPQRVTDHDQLLTGFALTA